jgi:hypothetical protein
MVPIKSVLGLDAYTGDFRGVTSRGPADHQRYPVGSATDKERIYVMIKLGTFAANWGRQGGFVERRSDHRGIPDTDPAAVSGRPGLSPPGCRS